MADTNKEQIKEILGTDGISLESYGLMVSMWLSLKASRLR